jgi:hypothetical protein
MTSRQASYLIPSEQAVERLRSVGAKIEDGVFSLAKRVPETSERSFIGAALARQSSCKPKKAAPLGSPSTTAPVTRVTSAHPDAENSRVLRLPTSNLHRRRRHAIFPEQPELPLQAGRSNGPALNDDQSWSVSWQVGERGPNCRKTPLVWLNGEFQIRPARLSGLDLELVGVVGPTDQQG